MKGGSMTTFEHAKRYAELGWHIFPLHTVSSTGKCSCGNESCADAGKHPRLRRGLKEASTQLSLIEDWFGELAAPSNIGIVTGAVSGITVVDIDIGEGKSGAESWAAIVAEHGEVETLMAETGSGGMHVIFKYNSALKTSGNVFGKGIDVRNDGGYIVAAPSRHRSGGAYSWMNWDIVGPPSLADLPSHLTKRKDEKRGRPRKDDLYRGKYSVEQVATMLEFVPPDDRDLWRSVGIILGREFDRVDEAWALYVTWSDKWAGTKGRNHNEIMHEAFYELSAKESGDKLTLGTLVRAAVEHGWAPKQGEVPVGHFVYFGPGNNYIYRPTVSFWIAPAVDAAVSPINENGKVIRASDWLRMNQLCTSMTSHPSVEEDLVAGFDCRNGEIVAVPGAALFNAYRRPSIELGDARLAGPFVEHVKKVFPKDGDADQFLNYMAHRVQHPGEKPRFALLLAGDQGVGKDTAVEFCVPAIGSWNVANIEPSALETSFNEYASSTLVRISEAANLHDMTKWAFNEKTKVLIAGSPDEMTINPKYGQKYSVKMFCGVIITTNHLSNGIFIPEGDRRYDVIAAAGLAEMGLVEPEARLEYFSGLWDWFLEGGSAHVAAYLHGRELGKWSAANGQRKTEAHRTVVTIGKHTDYWLQDALDEIEAIIGNVDTVRVDWIVQVVSRAGSMKASEVNPKMAHAMKRLDYELHKDGAMADGRHRFGKKKTVVYKRSQIAVVDLSALNRELF